MKKINFYLFLFVLLLIMALPVSAASTADTYENNVLFRFQDGSNAPADHVIFSYDDFNGNPVDTSNIDYAYNLYYAFDQNHNNKKYVIYCRMPGISRGDNGTITNQKEIFNSNDSLDKRAFSVGVNTILLRGYSNMRVDPYGYYFVNWAYGIGNGTLTPDEAQIATNIALRVYEMLWGGQDFVLNRPGISYISAKLAPFATMANEILDKNSTINNINLKTLIYNATGRPAPYIYYNSASETFGAGTKVATNYELSTDDKDSSNRIKAYADVLIHKAFEAAKEYKSNALQPSVTVQKKSSSQEVIKDNKGKVTGYKFIENYDITFNDFKNDSAFYLDSLTYPNGITASVIMDGRPISSGAGVVNPSFDLLSGNSAIRDGDGTIKLRLEFTTKSCTSNKRFSYILKYKYKTSHFDYSNSDEKELGERITDIQSYDIYKNSKTQHFFVYVGQNASKVGSVSNTITNNYCEVPETCDEIKNKCDNGDNSACIEWDNNCKLSCESYESQCKSQGTGSSACDLWNRYYPEAFQNNSCNVPLSTCHAYVSNTKCDTSPSKVVIQEGILGSNTCTEPMTSPNVKSCILESNDVNGNSYKSNLVSSSNKYCQVYCAENYEFTMPGDILVNKLRTLDVTVSAKGTKTCYSTMVKHENLESNIETIVAKIVTYYNQYLYYDAALNNRNSQGYRNDSASLSGHPHPCQSGSDSSCVCTEDLDEDGVNESDCTKYYGSVGASGGYNYIYKWSFNKFDIGNNYFNLNNFMNSLRNKTNVTCSLDGNAITCTYGSWGGNASCKDTGTEHYCTPGGDGTPITAYITTTDLNNAKTKLQEQINKLNSEMNEYSQCINWTSNMKYNFEPEIEFDYEVDLTGDDNKFNHKTILDSVDGSRVDGRTVVNKCAKETDDTYTECDSNWNSSLPTGRISIPSCSLINGKYSCTSTSYTYTKLKSMKASITSSENYNLDSRYTNVYYTGSILFNLDKIDIQNGRLLDSLYPVGSKLEASYDYSISVKNIGEYYNNSGNLGRIWGDTQSVYKTAVSQTNSCRTATKESSTIDGVTHDDGVYACTVQVTNGKSCEKVAGWYFCRDGKVCLQSDFERECGCAVLGENRYRLPNGRETNDKAEYEKACENPTGNKCTKSGGKFYCTNGNECTEDEYLNMCGCRPGDNGSTYYCADGSPCLQAQYEKECFYPGKPDPEPDCLECPVYCPPGQSCETEFCPQGNCPVTCPLCLFNENLNVHTRPVTPDNINPNDRDLGDNWESGINPTNPNAEVYVTTSLQLKAYATTKEIQQDSNLIYEVDFNSQNNNVGNNFAVEVTLDSSLIAYIKNYNANKGTYADNSLKCYDYKDTNGNTYENIYCYSTFIDDLVRNQGSKIKIKGNRLLEDNERQANTTASGYWTTFDKAINNKNSWHVVTTTHTLEYMTTKFGYDSVRKIDYGIGPSWK